MGRTPQPINRRSLEFETREFSSVKSWREPGVVVHACNPNSLGGWGRRVTSSAWAISQHPVSERCVGGSWRCNVALGSTLISREKNPKKNPFITKRKFKNHSRLWKCRDQLLNKLVSNITPQSPLPPFNIDETFLDLEYSTLDICIPLGGVVRRLIQHFVLGSGLSEFELSYILSPL